MQIRWGPFVLIFFVLFSIGFSGGDLAASNKTKMLKLKIKFIPKKITTRVFRVTGTDPVSVGPVMIKSAKMMVKGNDANQQISESLFKIQTRKLIVTGFDNTGTEEK